MGCMYQLRALLAICRQYPGTYVGPLILTAVLMGLGIFGVLAGADAFESSERSDVRRYGLGVADEVVQQMAQLFAPLYTMGAFVRLGPTKAAVDGYYPSMVDLIYKQSPALQKVNLAPQAYLYGNYSYPIRNVNTIDLIGDATRRADTLSNIEGGDNVLAVVGPSVISTGNFGAVCRLPIFLPNANAADTWGFDAVNPLCGARCTDAKTGSRFWGFVISTLDMTPYQQGTHPVLKKIRDDGFHYQILSKAGTLVAGSATPPVNAVTVTIEGTSKSFTWTLRIAPVEGWEPSWKWATLAAAIVFALGFAALAISLQVSRNRHRMLIKALIPDQLLRRLGDDFLHNSSKEAVYETLTPAHKILDITDTLIRGGKPSDVDVVMVRTAIRNSINIYRPLDVNNRMEAVLEEDIAHALINQFGVRQEATLFAIPEGSTAGGAGGVGTGGAGASSGSLSGPSMRTQVDRSLDSPLERLLHQGANEWLFDSFELEKLSDGRPLSTLGFFLLARSGLLTQLPVDQPKLVEFLLKVEAGYQDNPYHNKTHAADVLQTYHMLLTRGGMAHSHTDPLSLLACYVAAIVHDYDHCGVTNDFLIRTIDDLAVLYNEVSPLENHHAAAALGLMKLPGSAFLAAVPREEISKFRKMVIELVLATDMRHHFAHMAKFNTIHRVKAPGTGTSSAAAESGVHPLPAGAPAADEAERLLNLQMALKLADLGHVAESQEVHVAWVGRLEDEFFQQGDRERALGLPISPLFDRNKQGITKSQVGFFDFIVLPLVTNFTSVFVGCTPFKEATEDNYDYWKRSRDSRSQSSIGRKGSF